MGILAKVVVALDWTPNTVHTPLLVALAKGYYTEAGIEVQLINPQDDNYAVTPARKVLQGLADLAICPSESIIAFAETALDNGKNEKLQAVFALLDKDASSILCTAASGIKRAKDLDGKTYGSYNARYEDDLIRTMVRNDGGNGDIKIDTNVEKLSLFDLLMANEQRVNNHSRVELDATWIFGPWEGVKATQQDFHGIQLKLHEYGIPYGYSPVLARASTSTISNDILQKFLGATREGFKFALNNHNDAVKILQEYCLDETSEFLDKSLEDIKRYWAKERFGSMDASRWSEFLKFLQDNGLVKASLASHNLFINI